MERKVRRSWERENMIKIYCIKKFKGKKKK